MSIADKLNTIAENEQKVYEAGKQAEYDRFWEVFQKSGKRSGYGYAFYSDNFSDECYNPKYPIIARGSQSASCMFSYNKSITDTKVDILVDGTSSNTNMMFYNATNLRTIKKLLFAETTTIPSNTFSNTTSLENLVVEGVIGVSINLSSSPKLTHDSLMSIINCLKDYSADTSGTVYKLTLGGTNLAKLTEAETEIVYQKGWDIA